MIVHTNSIVNKLQTSTFFRVLIHPDLVWYFCKGNIWPIELCIHAIFVLREKGMLSGI